MSEIPPDSLAPVSNQTEDPGHPFDENNRASNAADPQTEALKQTINTRSIAPLPIYLTQHGRTQIGILETNAPWELDIDALVIPVGVQPGLEGGLAKAWLSKLGPSMSDEF